MAANHPRLLLVVYQAATLMIVGVAAGFVDGWVRAGELSATDVEAANAQEALDRLSEGRKGERAPSTDAGSDGGDVASERGDGDEQTASADATAAGEAETAQPEWVAWDTPDESWKDSWITVDVARQLYDAGAQFVDARIVEEFEAGHVPGAVRVNLEMIRSFEADDVVQRWLDPGLPVVVYCGGGDCDESTRVGVYLQEWVIPFDEVFILHAGWPGWEGRGLASQTGPGEKQ